MTKFKRRYLIYALIAVILFVVTGLIAAYTLFRRPYRAVVEESGIEPALIYAVMKAESGFDEKSESGAGAVGIMQIMPSTAEFICELSGTEYRPELLRDGEYNIRLGCFYLAYLMKRFPVTETALCAYNAGEGTVSGWVSDSALSDDGQSLQEIPFRETREYVKKVIKFKKIYEILY